MKKIITCILISFIVSNCIGQGIWDPKATCQGSVRYRAIAFEINGKCYMGTGSTGGGITQNLKDLWEFDPILNSWSQKVDLPDSARTNAVASSVGNYGYVGLGSNKGTLLQDWWQFDPLGNSWQAVANYPGIPRYGAGAFSLQDLIYVGGGLDGNNQAQSDFYAYNPSNNSWTPKASLPIGVSSAATFTIEQKGYFIAGASTTSINGTEQTIEYDPVNNSWTTKAPYAGGNTFSAVGFSLYGYGYVGTGFTGNLTDQMWRYNPILNEWTPETNWPTGLRQWAVSCTSGNKAYVGTGNSTGGQLFSDWWEFVPAFNNTNSLLANEVSTSIRFDPIQKEIIVMNSKSNEFLRIYDIEGKLLFEKLLNQELQSFSWNKTGVFFVTISDSKFVSSSKIACIN